MAKRTGGHRSAGSRGSERYVSDTGDLVWFSFSPQAGREQAGRRPELVLSPCAYNTKAGLCLVCPVTGQAKGYPFEVALPAGLKVTGVILSDAVKNLDWRARNVRYLAPAPVAVIGAVQQRLGLLLGLEER